MPRIDDSSIDRSTIDDTGRDIVSHGYPIFSTLEGLGAKAWRYGCSGFPSDNGKASFSQVVLVMERPGFVRMLVRTASGDLVEYEASDPDLTVAGQFTAVANHGPVPLDLPKWQGVVSEGE